MIKINNITKIYNKNKPNEFIGLDNVSLNIEEKNFIAIMGKSGAGKSTLMHIISCIDSFDKGQLEIDGQDVTKLKDKQLSNLRNKKIGIVLQDFALIEEYTVLENVLTPLYFDKIVKSEKIKRVKEVLKYVGLNHLILKEVSELSGGEKQRIAIARAMINNPKYLFADEPTGSLDVKNTEIIMELLKDMNKNGTTVVIITHDINIGNQCNKIIEVQDGKLI